MWVFTTYGFFSAVRSKDSPGMVMVRARARADLENLIKRHFREEEGDTIPPVLEWKARDYPYRIIIAAEDWSRVMFEAAEAVDYTNFKSAVADQQGYERSHHYGNVWETMYDLEHKMREASRPRSHQYGRWRIDDNGIGRYSKDWGKHFDDLGLFPELAPRKQPKALPAPASKKGKTAKGKVPVPALAEVSGKGKGKARKPSHDLLQDARDLETYLGASSVAVYAEYRGGVPWLVVSCSAETLPEDERVYMWRGRRVLYR